jgi:hypothetical protein
MTILVLCGLFHFVPKRMPLPFLKFGLLHLKCKLPFAFNPLSLTTASSPLPTFRIGAMRRESSISSLHLTLPHTMAASSAFTAPYSTKPAQCFQLAKPPQTYGTNSAPPPPTSQTSPARQLTMVRPLINYGTTVNHPYPTSVKLDAVPLRSSQLTTLRFIIVPFRVPSSGMHQTQKPTGCGTALQTASSTPSTSPSLNITNLPYPPPTTPYHHHHKSFLRLLSHLQHPSTFNIP